MNSKLYVHSNIICTENLLIWFVQTARMKTKLSHVENWYNGSHCMRVPSFFRENSHKISIRRFGMKRIN